MEDAFGPVRGGQALRGFEEGPEGGDGEGVTLSEGREDAAELGDDNRRGELKGMGVGVETGDAAAGAVGGGGHGGGGRWGEMGGYEGR